MPIYEYQCAACSHRLESLQRMSDPPLEDCPACGQPSLRKLVSAAGFRLKGSGWYVTDFRDGQKKGAGKGAAESATSAAEGETKSGAGAEAATAAESAAPAKGAAETAAPAPTTTPKSGGDGG